MFKHGELRVADLVNVSITYLCFCTIVYFESHNIDSFFKIRIIKTL